LSAEEVPRYVYQFFGALDSDSARAVMHLAMTAHGWTVDEDRYTGWLEETFRLGVQLRDDVLPTHLPEWATDGYYWEAARTDRELWDRLVWIFATGHQHASYLARLLRMDDRPDTGAERSEIGILGAAVTGVAVVLDQLSDEKQLGAAAVEQIQQSLPNLFDPQQTDTVAFAYAQTEETLVRLMLALLGVCERLGKVLLATTRRADLWQEIAQRAGRLFAAQRNVSNTQWGDEAQLAALLPAIEEKSAGVSSLLLAVAALTTGVAPSESVRQTAAAAGKVMWYVDDAADLLEDWNHGRPNRLHLLLLAQARSQGRDWATDTDVVTVLDRAALELIRALAKLTLAPSGISRQDAAGDPAGERPGLRELLDLRVRAWLQPHPPVARFGLVVATHSQERGRWRTPAQVATVRSVRDAIDAALHFLMQEQRLGFAEAEHAMTFPRIVDGRPRLETHSALLFQRATVLDCLLDAANSGLPVSTRVLTRETIAVLKAKHPLVAGGWSYIPQVPELAPDADDLGIVLQVLLRVGGPALARLCRDAIALALEAQQSDGGFPTWVLDPLARGSGAQALRDYLWIGGAGVHPEVVANLVTAVALADPAQYATALDRAASYLERVQHTEGSWPSRWYAGPWYGTYRATQALRLVRPDSPSLPVARLLSARALADRGTAQAATLDPLSTAFALLVLHETRTAEDTEQASIAAGIQRLLVTRQADGGWPAELWGSFDTGIGTETYASRTITTAFALKALTAHAWPAARWRERDKAGKVLRGRAAPAGGHAPA
jgi:Squalene-hopene cyclase C-terminal domain